MWKGVPLKKEVFFSFLKKIDYVFSSYFRLWRDVTYGLKSNDIEAATAGKFALEQRQREEAAQRKEAGVKWDTKLFHQIGENWFFNEPLPKRIRDHKLAA